MPDSTESTATKPEDTKDVTGKGADATANPDSDDDEEDLIEAAIQARLALEVERKADELAAKKLAIKESELSEAQRKRDSEVEQTKLRESFAEAVKSTRNALKTLEIYDSAGKRVEFTDTAFEDLVVKPFQKHNSEAEKAHQSVVVNALTQAALDSLPAEMRSDFTSRAGNKPINEWLKTYAEMYAPNAEAIKELKREEDAKIKAAEARGFAKGQKSKGGSAPNPTERSANNEQTDLTTQIGLIRAYMGGKLNESEYIERRRKLERGA